MHENVKTEGDAWEWFGVYNKTNYSTWDNIDGVVDNPFHALPFGDEDDIFHNLKMVYDADNDIIYAYVDDIFLYSKTVIYDELIIAFYAKSIPGNGMSVIEFDNFRYSNPEPSTIMLLSLGTIILRKRNK